MPEIIAQRSNRDVEPDTPTISKAIGDRLGGRRQPHLHSFHRADLDAVRTRATAKSPATILGQK
jgi:hypothetical protein